MLGRMLSWRNARPTCQSPQRSRPAAIDEGRGGDVPPSPEPGDDPPDREGRASGLRGGGPNLRDGDEARWGSWANDRARRQGRQEDSGRRIPLHPDLRAALHDLEPDRRARVGPVIRSARGGAMTAKSIVNWFTWACREASLDGCSSHSARRTFVTRAARLVYRGAGSLRDVQEPAAPHPPPLATKEGRLTCRTATSRSWV